jgi:SAM-dependent methyltransferase
VDWVPDFYAKQYAWAGWAERWSAADLEEVSSRAAGHVDAVARLAGERPMRVLELGAGSGFTAAALAAVGHDVVAIDLIDACVRSIARLAVQVGAGSLRAIQDDFYSVDLDERFDLVCYFDGFGIGTDDDQRRLLRRIATWLAPGGCALLDVFTPWYWAKLAGTVEEFPPGSGVSYEEGFDAGGCRMVERMWLQDEGKSAVRQSLRCYSPADLRLLLEPTELTLVEIEAYEDEQHRLQVPLAEAMLYLAKLV